MEETEGLEEQQKIKPKFWEKEFRTPLGIISGKKIKTFLTTFEKIIKAIVARSLYALYTVLIVWRVTVALNDNSYWSLLFCISLIGVETLHTIVLRGGGELKWVTPSVFFYLVCAVPSIWLLELKLLADRQSNKGTNCTDGTPLTPTSVIELQLSDDDWTLAMEQILIFVLVFGKWIAPKGELTRDQLSQLLLVQLGTGADIMELLESFNEAQVSNNADIVYLVMSIWSWSLLQFCIVPTTFKKLPDVDTPIKPDEFDSLDKQKDGKKDSNAGSKSRNGTTNNVGAPNKQNIDQGVSESVSKGKSRVENKPPEHKAPKTSTKAGARNKVGVAESQIITESVGSNTKKKQNGQMNPSKSAMQRKGNENIKSDEIPNGQMKDMNNVSRKQNGKISSVQTPKVSQMSTIAGNQQTLNDSASWDHAIIVIHDREDNLKIEDTADEWISGKRCCTSFCFYNEIWGMVLALVFQDGPFLLTRLVIMFHYKVVSHMTVFFTFKNIVTIVLVLNRIRVVVLEEKKEWRQHMREVLTVRKRNAELLREKRRRQLAAETQNRTQHRNDCTTVAESNDRTEDAPKPKSKSFFKKPRWLFWRS